MRRQKETITGQIALLSSDAPGLTPSTDSPSVGDVVALLQNLHEGERSIPRIVACGDPAVPALESLLRGPSQTVPHSRCWAADALAGIGSDAAIKALVRALQDASTRHLAPAPQEAEAVVIGRIVEHLSSVPGAAISDALLEALRLHPTSPSCVHAVGVRVDRRALPLLAACLFDDASRGAAVHALKQYGTGAIPYVADAASAPTIGVAMESFIHIEGRRTAVQLLGCWLASGASVGPDHTELLRSSLVHALQDPQRTVRLAAALALSRVKNGQPESVVDILVSALEEATWPQLESVMSAIQSLGTRAIAALTRVIADPDSPGLQRLRAVVLAGKMNARGTAPLLAALSTEADGRIRLEAARALARMRPKIDARLLGRFLEDPIARVRRTAFVALCRAHALGMDRVFPFVADSDRHIRHVARFLLRSHPGPAAPLLARGLRSGGRPGRGLWSRWRLWRQAGALLIDIFACRKRKLKR